MRLLRVEQLERRDMMTGVAWTAHDQLLLELINRAREDPLAEAARYSIDLNAGLAAGTISSAAKQPLAPNEILMGAAAEHSQDMLDQDYFSHTNLAGQSPSDRAQAAGYSTWVGENIAWGGTTGTVNQVQHVHARHQNLFLSAGHRQNMLNASYEEIGVGVRFGQYTVQSGGTYNASMVTEKFGAPRVASFITGVVFTDAADGSTYDDDFYSIGEQVSGGTITATNTSSGAIYSTSISASGGYALSVGSGTFDVVVTLASGQTYQVTGVTVGSDNVKVDFETTTATPGGGGNAAPILASIADVLIPLNQTQLHVALSANDSDGDSLTYSATVQPGVSGITATVNGSTLTLAMAESVRETFTMTVTVSDGLASDSEQFDVTKGIRVYPHAPLTLAFTDAVDGGGVWEVGEAVLQSTAAGRQGLALAAAANVFDANGSSSTASQLIHEPLAAESQPNQFEHFDDSSANMVNQGGNLKSVPRGSQRNASSNSDTMSDAALAVYFATLGNEVGQWDEAAAKWS